MYVFSVFLNIIIDSFWICCGFLCKHFESHQLSKIWKIVENFLCLFICIFFPLFILFIYMFISPLTTILQNILNFLYTWRKIRQKYLSFSVVTVEYPFNIIIYFGIWSGFPCKHFESLRAMVKNLKNHWKFLLFISPLTTILQNNSNFFIWGKLSSISLEIFGDYTGNEISDNIEQGLLNWICTFTNIY